MIKLFFPATKYSKDKKKLIEYNKHRDKLIKCNRYKHRIVLQRTKIRERLRGRNDPMLVADLLDFYEAKADYFAQKFDNSHPLEKNYRSLMKSISAMQEFERLEEL